MKAFTLEILTPEHEFYSGRAYALTVFLPDGPYTILANHTPMVVSLDVGHILIRTEEDTVRQAFNSEGFLDVSIDKVIIFTQACEWPEQIDEKRALAAQKRAEERIARQKNTAYHHSAEVSLTRAIERLRLKGTSKK